MRTSEANKYLYINGKIFIASNETEFLTPVTRTGTSLQVSYSDWYYFLEIKIWPKTFARGLNFKTFGTIL